MAVQALDKHPFLDEFGGINSGDGVKMFGWDFWASVGVEVLSLK